MRKHNGKQLYGIHKILTTLKMGMNKELRKLPLKQKLAMNYVSKESKLTMLSFGNILEKPLPEIWAETSKHFCTPGPACYANISNDVIFSKKKAQWPLNKQATLEILDECPSYDQKRLPEFYKKIGFPLN